MKASMVDVSDKRPLKRTVLAEGTIKLRRATVAAVKAGKVAKGDPLSVAQVAAISAVKRTPDLVPLCHQIPLEKVDVRFRLLPAGVKAQVEVSATAKTGVEMEAIVGVLTGLAVVWDMVKYLEKDADGQYPETVIEAVRVVRKEKNEP